MSKGSRDASKALKELGNLKEGKVKRLAQFESQAVDGEEKEEDMKEDIASLKKSLRMFSETLNSNKPCARIQGTQKKSERRKMLMKRRTWKKRC